MGKQRINVKNVQKSEDKPFNLPVVVARVEPDEDAWGKDGLTLKQRLFVKAYVGPAAGNASKAARMAGYRSENTNSLAVTACENLSKPNVARAIARALVKKSGGKKWVMAGIVEIARTSMVDFVSYDPNGKPVLDLVKARDAAALGCVKKMKFRDTDAGPEIQIELYDRMPALRTLAQIHGSLIERTEHSGTVETRQTIDLRNLTVEELNQLHSILSASSRRAGEPVHALPARSN